MINEKNRIIFVTRKQSFTDLKWKPPLNVRIDTYGIMKRILFQNIFSAVPIAIDRPRGIKLKRKQNAENSYNSKSSSEITPLASNCCAMCVESLCSITSPLPVCYIVLKPRRVFSRCFSIQKGSASLSGKAAPFFTASYRDADELRITFLQYSFSTAT